MIRLFRVSIPKSIIGLVVYDFALISICFITAAWMLTADIEVYLLYENGLIHLATAAAGMLLGLYYQNLYNDFSVRSRFLLLQRLALVIGAVLILQAVISYINPSLATPRDVMLGTAALLVFFPFWRTAYTSVLYKTFGIDRVLFLGTDELGIELAQNLSDRPQVGLEPIGFITDEKSSAEDVKVLGQVSRLMEIVEQLAPDRIIVNITERRNQLPVDDLLDLRFRGIRILEAASVYESVFGRVTIRKLRPSQLIFSSELGPQPWNMRIQKLYSFLFGTLGLIIAAPIMLVVAVAVKLTSSGPVLYSQRRVGLNGRPFMVHKFRSMVVNAEAKTGAVWATRNDPRVTPIGRILRRSRLDELPQLFNVIRGEMSIVGPRPERPEFVATLSEQIPFYRQRHCVKPGLTGWAQINYKYGDTIEDTIVKLEYDLYYIKNLSPSLDMYIIFHTIKVMLFSQSGQ